MHQGVIDWARATILPDMITDKRLLEVGSLYHNGSMRFWFEEQKPAEYVGIDILDGQDVDVVLSANDLLDRYGPARWDLIICLEMLEHCEQWQDAVYQMKRSLSPGGWLILTTRSPGYPFHAPPDHWRYPKELLRDAFDDLDNVATWSDPGFTVPNAEGEGGIYYPQPGVFIRGQRINEGLRRPVGQAEPAPPMIENAELVDPMTGKVVNGT